MDFDIQVKPAIYGHFAATGQRPSPGEIARRVGSDSRFPSKTAKLTRTTSQSSVSAIPHHGRQDTQRARCSQSAIGNPQFSITNSQSQPPDLLR
jgi:hypothetical protein